MEELEVGHVVELPKGSGGPSRVRLYPTPGSSSEREVTAHVDASIAATLEVGDWVRCRAFGFVDGNTIYEIVSLAERPQAGNFDAPPRPRSYP